MNEIGRRCDKQAEELQHGTRRISELERIEPHLHVAHRELENQMTGRLRNLENVVQKQNEYQKRAASASAPVSQSRDLDQSLLQEGEKERDREQVKKQLQKMGTAQQSAEGRLHSLENKIAALMDTVASLRGGVDLTHEYWKGLTKGVQKTHRSVLSEDEIFSKNPLSKPLPSLGAR